MSNITQDQEWQEADRALRIEIEQLRINQLSLQRLIEKHVDIFSKLLDKLGFPDLEKDGG